MLRVLISESVLTTQVYCTSFHKVQVLYTLLFHKKALPPNLKTMILTKYSEKLTINFINNMLKSRFQEINLVITKNCLCNVYPFEPHFYIAKLGYAWVYLFFLFLLQNIDCGYSLEPPRQGGSNVYPQFMFKLK